MTPKPIFGFLDSIEKMVGDARFELETELDDTQTNILIFREYLYF
jgi:hypothetical protein